MGVILTSEQDRKANILKHAAEILKDQSTVENSVTNELDEIANRVEAIAAELVST